MTTLHVVVGLPGAGKTTPAWADGQTVDPDWTEWSRRRWHTLAG